MHYCFRDSCSRSTADGFELEILNDAPDTLDVAELLNDHEKMFKIIK